MIGIAAITRQTSEIVINALAHARNALEAGNWKEAWQWLRFTKVSDVKIPEEILEKAWKLE